MNFDGAIDPRFADVWAALRPSEPGHTVDPTRNPMRADKSPPQRIDRVLARTTRWTPRAIELLGTSPIEEQTFISDHFGLEVELAPA